MDIERIKDEAYLIKENCKSITVACNKILEAEDSIRVSIVIFVYLFNLHEKITKLNKAYAALQKNQ